MKKLCALCAAVLFAAVAFHNPAAHVQAKSNKFHKSSRPVPNRYIVVLDSNQDFRSDPDGTIEDLNKYYPGSIGHVFSSAINGYSVEMPRGLAVQLSDDPRVKYVEEDSFTSATDIEYNPGWALDRIDQHAMPYDSMYNFTNTGSGVNVYVLDSGILTTHVDIQGRAFIAYDAIHDNTPISQCNGHGTGVAGVIGGSTYGVAKQVSLYSVRVLPCAGTGTVSDVVSGVDWVTRHAVHPAVANISLQALLSATLNDAVTNSIASGVTYVVAAGNNNDNACSWSPSAVSGAIVVAATNYYDQRLAYSNYGTCVDLFAPGEGVSTIWNSNDTIFTYASGTSFASPLVAGVAALYLEQNPNATPDQVQSALISSGTAGGIGDVGVDSPNLLLFSQMAPPPPPPTGCGGLMFNGSLNSPGSSDFQSSSSGFAGAGGLYSGNLQAPTGAVFSLSLERKAKNRWSAVATSSSGQPVAYSGRSGTYRWRVAAASGTGSYSLCAMTP